MHVPSQRVIRPQGTLTEWLAGAKIPTRYGEFHTHVFRSVRALDPADPDDVGAPHLPQEHVALVFGDVRGRQDTLVRVHSECITSEVFGSLKCDCKEQLDAAMAAVSRAGAGAILYLRQEGRGIGLANKIKAYALQSHGHDTVDANRLLGLPDDARRYDVARDMLSHLEVASVRLLTNNPAKVTALRRLGVRVVGKMPIVVAPTQHSARYLETKRDRMAHELPVTLGSRAGGGSEAAPPHTPQPEAVRAIAARVTRLSTGSDGE